MRKTPPVQCFERGRFFGALEPEAVDLDLVGAGIFERERFLVYRFTFDVDGFVRGGRADVFAAAAPYADLRVGVGNGQSVAVGDHAHRLCGAVFGASPATGAVGMDDAKILDEDHPPYLGAVFFFDAQGEDRSVGAYVRADGAVVVAEALVEVHHRLHHPGEAVFEQCRFEHSRRAFADAQVASGASVAPGAHVPANRAG